MKRYNFKDTPAFLTIFEKDENGREINLYRFCDVSIGGESLTYPNPVLYVDNDIVVPINESIMSLKDIQIEGDIESIKVDNNNKFDTPVFYFIYNTENYYHFVYDTLPYLISFFKLKEIEPNLKLLMSYPNQTKHEHYKFVLEFLEILGIQNSDIKIVDGKTNYSTVYISTSYTHDNKSNLPPRKEIFSFYKSIVEKINVKSETPKKVYISRRSWIHGDFSNIGTNYTTRRKMVNEDDLVKLLTENGFVEIFTETMSTIDKLIMFSNAEVIVGAIGGGICNVVFSPNETKLIALISPCFLDVNKRFLFSLNNVDLTLFDDVMHSENTVFKTNMRVKSDEIVGEIFKINNDNTISVNYSEVKIAGWNNETKYKTITLNMDNCVKLDEGLNSPWKINIEAFKEKFL